VADESLIETDSPVEVSDQIVAEDEKQLDTNNGKEEFVAATEADSDAVEPDPVVTESDITSSEPAPQETPGSCFLSVSLSALLSHLYLHMEILVVLVCHYPKLQLKSNIFCAVRCMFKSYLLT